MHSSVSILFGATHQQDGRNTFEKHEMSEWKICVLWFCFELVLSPQIRRATITTEGVLEEALEQ